MTELEKFRDIFEGCSIWRGGGSNAGQLESGLTGYDVHFAVDGQPGTGHEKYVHYVFWFDQKGAWVSTTEGQGKPLRSR